MLPPPCVCVSLHLGGILIHKHRIRPATLTTF
jgi:hypothetical protein